MTLRIYKTEIEQLNWYPTQDDWGKFVLVWLAPLNMKLAERLRCKGLCYDEQGHPRSFEGKVGLKLKIVGSTVGLGELEYESPLIHKFKVFEGKGDSGLMLSGRIHFEGSYECLMVWCREKNSETFSFSIQPAQGELFDGADDPVEAQLENATATAPKATGSLASSRQMSLAAAAPGKKADKPN